MKAKPKIPMNCQLVLFLGLGVAFVLFLLQDYIAIHPHMLHQDGISYRRPKPVVLSGGWDEDGRSGSGGKDGNGRQFDDGVEKTVKKTETSVIPMNQITTPGSKLDAKPHNATKTFSSATSNPDLFVAARFEARRVELANRCRKVEQLPRYVAKTKQIFLYTASNVMVCEVAKSGATTWKRHLLNMHGVKGYIKNPHDRKYYRVFLASKILPHLDQALVTGNMSLIITSRHPLSRLVSAYQDKFNDGQRGIDLYWMNLKNKYCRNKKDKVTFEEFLCIVVKEQATVGELKMNNHWQPYSSSCSVCDLPYRYIMRQETFNQDLTILVSHLNLTQIKVDIRLNNKGNNAHHKNFEQYFSKVDERLLRKVVDIYRLDMLLFNYSLPQSIAARLN